MVMKKTVASRDVVIVSNVGDENAFPVNYRYIMGDIMYTVVRAFRTDNTEMRRLVTQAGDVQELTVASMFKDKLEHDFKELEPKK